MVASFCFLFFWMRLPTHKLALSSYGKSIRSARRMSQNRGGCTTKNRVARWWPSFDCAKHFVKHAALSLAVDVESRHVVDPDRFPIYSSTLVVA